MRHKHFAILMLLLIVGLVIGVKCNGQDTLYVNSKLYVIDTVTAPEPIAFKIKYKNKKWLAFNVEYDEDKKVVQITLFKPLRAAYYRYPKLRRLGFECKPFRGSVFINYKRYLELVNNKTVIK